MFRKLTTALLLVPVLACAQEDGREASGEEMRPGFFSRVLNVFRGSPDRIENRGETQSRGAVISVDYQPETVRLDVTRRLAVEVVVENRGKKLVTLDFPTTQRLEIQIVAPTGEVVTRWSEDRAFSPTLGTVTINPGEKIVYRETISVRDLKSGNVYTLEAFLPGYPDMVAKARIEPVE